MRVVTIYMRVRMHMNLQIGIDQPSARLVHEVNQRMRSVYQDGSEKDHQQTEQQQKSS